MSKTLEISDETYEKIKAQLTEEESIDLDTLDEMVGHKWFIRTVTYHLVGKIHKRVGNFFYLKAASWVADSGRFMNAIKDGTLNEVEPVGDCMVSIASIVDMFPWKHTLDLKQQ